MLLPHGTVFAVVDGEKFELYRNTGMEAEPVLTPMPVPELDATNKSAGVRHNVQPGEPNSNRLDEDAHVAAVTDWLNGQVLKQKIDKLVIIADPKSLGEMRMRYHKELENILMGDVASDMTGRSGEDIVASLRSK